ncbi:MULTISPECIES: TonB-dependent siderophore receptor [unclassified Duganella]|uniref:TonB-dependent siderophore receptor n=1 Tax=unclassified Duganella TaxID=2636909 RepID=UPI0008844687|nr:MULTISPECIES: TonB-dependent siderophore receptor [unclassified Duganella]SDF50709.1 iron complex outermembrane recepter protein [Duganella sp. OV458]SDI76348.1 iron complex outermembrane recepter protein [Duganella sp. OV510]
MSTPNFAVSAIALAVLQMTSGLAHAAGADADAPEQTMQEVVVSAAKTRAATAAVAGFSNAPLLETPASVSVLTAQQMLDLQIRSTTDAARYDASLSDAYNAVGYAEQFSIRGFKLDNASSYRKDGMAIAGDTQIPLENKERLEVLKGLSGLQAGVSAPGGIINYVTKRPTDTPLRTVVLEARERGTLYGALDLGGRFENSDFGYRVNVAGERLRSYIKGADGNRKFVSAAFDWRISPQALLQVDADYQRKSQITAPGYQLLNNATLPDVPADQLLNDQPWSRPVETTSSNVGARFTYQFSPEWNATVSVNQHHFKRDDYTAFPYGCGAQELYPGFCGNGDYDVYNYISLGEKKSPLTAQALLQGRFATGSVKHEFTGGASFFKNSEKWGDDLYDWSGTSNIYHPVIVAPAPGSSGPVSERRRDNERALFAQDIVSLNEQLKLHAGARYVQVKRDEYVKPDDDGVLPPYAHTDIGFWLPNVALVYAVRPNVSTYISYAQGLEHGGVAPKGTENEHRALEPGKSKQVEVGIKADIRPDLSATVALFQIRKGLEYTDAAKYYVRNGEAQNRGLELALNGRVNRDLDVGFSATALNTRQSGTGSVELDGKRVTNVAAFKSSVYADYAVPAVQGLKVGANWIYSGKKAFDAANSVFVPKYHVVNLSASYSTRIGGVGTTFRAAVDNAFDKFYWRDVTPDLGGYLMPGASRTVRVSAQFDL